MPVRHGCTTSAPAIQPSLILPREAAISATKVAAPTPTKKTTKQDHFELAANGDANADYARLVKRMRLWQEFLAAAYGVSLKIDYTLPLFVKPEKIEAGDKAQTIIEKNTINERASIANDKKPEVFLTKYMTDIFAVQGSNVYSVEDSDAKPSTFIQSGAVLNCAYQNLLLRYEHERKTFSVTGLRGDLSSQRAKDDEIFTNNSLFELTKAALILAQSAKAAGWTS